MKTQARAITTNQVGVHDDLVQTVLKYQSSEFQKPVAMHTQAAFDSTLNYLQEWSGDVIIDACCGVGESTARLAALFPQSKVIGIDKSQARLAKHEHYEKNVVGTEPLISEAANHIILQADLNDYWRLLSQSLPKARWQISQQFLLYPNPYPKKAQLQKRWHASPTFKAMLACGHKWEVRSNWLVYLEEFKAALAVYNIESIVTPVTDTPMTPFERKYLAAQQNCWRLTTV